MTSSLSCMILIIFIPLFKPGHSSPTDVNGFFPSKKENMEAAEIDSRDLFKSMFSSSNASGSSRKDSMFDFESTSSPKKKAKVAFMVYSTSTYRPGGHWTFMVFDTMTLNMGNGFSLNTNHFTAPYSGVYVFSLRAASKSGHYAWFALFKNRNIIAQACTSSSNSYFDSAEMTNILKLDKGDDVWGAMYPSSSTYLYGNGKSKFTAFSGFLLFET